MANKRLAAAGAVSALAMCLVGVSMGAAQTKLLPVNEQTYKALIAARKGKVVMVDFWATWCKPCRAEMPQLANLAAKLKVRGVEFVTISADEPEQEAAAARFAAETRIPAPAYIRRANDDDQFIRSIDAKWSGALPALFLYDRSGRNVKSFIGETPMKDIEAAINRLL
jgi:thiol-disulfide isomerase/thioredoxin